MLLIITIFYSFPARAQEITVGSKTFTESVILGEVLKQIIEEQGYEAQHLKGLGGTRVLWNSMLKGEIDIYAEYTGTLTQEIFSGVEIESQDQLQKQLLKHDIVMSKPLGFNNTYILGMKKAVR